MRTNLRLCNIDGFWMFFSVCLETCEVFLIWKLESRRNKAESVVIDICTELHGPTKYILMRQQLYIGVAIAHLFIS